jgi:hypothetical protein
MLKVEMDLADHAESRRGGVESVEEPGLCVCLRIIGVSIASSGKRQPYDISPRSKRQR